MEGKGFDILMELKNKMVENNKALQHSKFEYKDEHKENKMNKISNMICRRGEIFYSDLDGNQGSEQGGIRPVVIIQNDIGNRYSPTVIVAVLTTRINKTKIPTHLEIESDKLGLPKDSVILFEQIRTLDKRRLREKVCILDEFTMMRVDKAIKISLFNQKPKTTFDRLNKEDKNFVITKLNKIKECNTVLSFLTRVNGSKKDIDIAEDEKFEAENALMTFCYEKGLNCEEFYTQERGVNEALALQELWG